MRVVGDDDEFEATGAVEGDDDLEADDDEELPLGSDEGEEADESSLEELLAQRAAARRAPDETDEDEDIMSTLASEKEQIPSVEPLPSRVVPLKDRQEFVCNSCHLVKAKVQLADTERGLCRDCV